MAPFKSWPHSADSKRARAISLKISTEHVATKTITRKDFLFSVQALHDRNKKRESIAASDFGDMISSLLSVSSLAKVTETK